MPITFACACGKPFTVADEYAGKRTKCPGCGAALTVPAAAAEPEELSEEEKAFRALEEAPDTEPAPRAPGAWDSGSNRAAAPAPVPAGGKPVTPKRTGKFRKASAEEREARKDREPRPRDPDRVKKVLYMIGGGLMILLGVGLVFLSFDGGSIRGGLFGGLLAFGGVGTFFQGATGDFNEE